MARFDVYRLEISGQLVVLCQSEYLDHLPTRFVMPLIPIGRDPPIANRLNPKITFDGRDYVLASNAAATVRLTQIRSKAGSLTHEQDAILKALDLLISGF